MQGRSRSLNQAGRHASSTARSIAEIYVHYGIPHKVEEGDGGWVSTHCPFCRGSADYHLGYSVQRSYFTCWRCGWHDPVKTLSALCGLGSSEAWNIFQSIRTGPRGPVRGTKDKTVQAKVSISLYRPPPDTGPMRANHRRYLEGRGFDPDKIEREWGVLGTGPMAYLDGIDYRFRLFIPIWWNGHEASFQTRDVTGKSQRKYMACPVEREIKHHKHILYGDPEAWGSVGIIVEGVTDVWRLGTNACATFGITYTDEQVREIAKRFKRVAIVFDAERQAQVKAKRLAAQLRLRLDDAPIVVNLPRDIDPGSMKQNDADHLVRELVR